MINANVKFKGVDERGAIVSNKVEVVGPGSAVVFEIAALLECLYDIDYGKTLCAAMDLHLAKLKA